MELKIWNDSSLLPNSPFDKQSFKKYVGRRTLRFISGHLGIYSGHPLIFQKNKMKYSCQWEKCTYKGMNSGHILAGSK